MSENHLKTARVLVVDDVFDEAKPIIQALGKSGIGCIYHSGDKIEDFPDKPFEGIRVVFLDLRLSVGGENHLVLSKTVEVLRVLVKPETMPLLVLCWTKHPDDVNKFSDMAIKDIPGLKPGFIKGIPKPNKKVDDWPANFYNELIPKIEKIINNYPPVGILWDWEQVVHESVSMTTQTLAETVLKGIKVREEESIRSEKVTLEQENLDEVENNLLLQTQWLEELKKCFKTLLRAETGQINAPQSEVKALFNVLNHLVADRMNHNVIQRKFPLSAEVFSGEIGALEVEQKALLNQMLIFEPLGKEGAELYPGNIYLPISNSEKECLHAICRFDFMEMGKEMIRIGKEKDEGKALQKQIKKCEDTIKKKPDDSVLKNKLDELLKKKEDLVVKTLNTVRPVLVDVTPSCDFFQKNRPVARFIGGILIPEKYAGILKNTQWMRTLAHSTIPGEKEISVLAMSSRHQFGVSNPEENISNTPLCRLRSQMLVDIRVWASFQAARPGNLSIRIEENEV